MKINEAWAQSRIAGQNHSWQNSSFWYSVWMDSAKKWRWAEDLASDENVIAGVYILQNTMARGGMVPEKKMKNEAVRNKMKKKEKGERKKK